MVYGDEFNYPSNVGVKLTQTVTTRPPTPTVQTPLSTQKLLNQNDVLVKPVYNFSEAMKEIKLPIGQNDDPQNRTVSTIALSTLIDMLVIGDTSNNSNQSNEPEQFISTSDALPYVNSGDNTDFTMSFPFVAYEHGIAKYLQMEFALGQKCDTFVAALSLSSVRVRILEIKSIAGSTSQAVFDIVFSLSGKIESEGNGENAVTIFRINRPVDFVIDPNNRYFINIAVVGTYGGSTGSIAYMPIFSTMQPNILKPFHLSSGKLRYYPLVTNGFSITRQQDAYDKFDHGGTDIKGVKK